LRKAFDFSPKKELVWPDDDNEMSNAELSSALSKMGVLLPALAVVSHEAVALRRRLREANIPARNWLSRKVGGTGGTRLAAVKLTRGLICDGKKHRGIQVAPRCHNLLDEIQAGYRNKEGPDGLEDQPADGDDHACQALESWIWLRGPR
jgi:hypothetical protein